MVLGDADYPEGASDEHLAWMLQAMEMVCAHILHRNNTGAHMQAEEALAASEVPVGCVFVRDGKAIAKARNRTNELRNVWLHTPPDVPLADARLRCRQPAMLSSRLLTPFLPILP